MTEHVSSVIDTGDVKMAATMERTECMQAHDCVCGTISVEIDECTALVQYYFGSTHTCDCNTAQTRDVVFFPGDYVDSQQDSDVIERVNNPAVLMKMIFDAYSKSEDELCVRVFYIRPHHYYEGCYANYCHLLNKLTPSGEPLGYSGKEMKATNNCLTLIKTALIRHQGSLSECCLSKSVSLLGFSKGGVVLNQIMHEMDYAFSKSLYNSHELLQAIDTIHYIDVGLPGRGAYPTVPSIWTTLSEINKDVRPIKIIFHGSGRTWKDSKRVWLVKEKNICVELAMKHRVPCTEKFEVCGQMMIDHFSVIDKCLEGIANNT